MTQNRITTLVVVLLFPLVFAQSNEVCPDVKTCLKILGQAFDTLCDDTTNVPQCSCPVEWESFNMIQLGTINMGTTGTQSYVIPSTVPSTAREVLVYVYINMGRSQDLFGQIKIYTESSPTRRFEKYLAIKTYNQEAWSTASDNMFFPMTSNRRVYVRLTRTFPGNVHGTVNVIGYR